MLARFLTSETERGCPNSPPSANAAYAQLGVPRSRRADDQRPFTTRVDNAGLGASRVLDIEVALESDSRPPRGRGARAATAWAAALSEIRSPPRAT
jgi:hypothetical protein